MNPKTKIADISYLDLVPMDMFADLNALRIQLVYAQKDNYLFGEQIYRSDARLWLHKDLAKIVLLAGMRLYRRHGYSLNLYDGLRTVEAQEKMIQTARVKQNPQWLQEPRLLSPPGMGAHPRGMAIDLSLADPSGQDVDMGTEFDFLAANPGPEHNPAHRQYRHISKCAQQNRNMLDNALFEASGDLGINLVGLPQEWWDFRLPNDVYNAFAPLADKDLPQSMRMVESTVDPAEDERPTSQHYDTLKATILSELSSLA